MDRRSTWFVRLAGLVAGPAGCKAPDSASPLPSRVPAVGVPPPVGAVPVPDGCFARFVQQPPAAGAKLDIVFVADTSGSLDDEQAPVASALARLVSNIDARATITSRPRAADPVDPPVQPAEPGPGRRRTHPSPIRSPTRSPSTTPVLPAAWSRSTTARRCSRATRPTTSASRTPARPRVRRAICTSSRSYRAPRRSASRATRSATCAR